MSIKKNIELNSKNVDKIFKDCLLKEEEVVNEQPICEYLTTQGVIQSFYFHKERLAKHNDEIQQLIEQLPHIAEPVSFLQLCVNKNGVQWAEHKNIEQLVTLGIATENLKYLFPKELWLMLPGGVPVIVASDKFLNRKNKSNITEFRMTAAYNIKCKAKFDDENTGYNEYWNGSIIVSDNNLFYGIAKNEVGMNNLMVGVYLPNKGIKFRTFDGYNDEKYITEYTDIKDCDIEGTIYIMSSNHMAGIGECQFDIKEDYTINIGKLNVEINEHIYALENKKFQKNMFLYSVKSFEDTIEDIKDKYKKRSPFSM